MTAGKRTQRAAVGARSAGLVTAADLLDGQVGLDVACLDRIYLNSYVPTLQVGGQVWWFFVKHLGFPIASPAIMEKIGTRFRRAVSRFAEDNQIPVSYTHLTL